MYYLKTYKNRNCARIALGNALKRMGMRIADINYELKRNKVDNRVYPVIDMHNNGKRIVEQLQAEGFVITH